MDEGRSVTCKFCHAGMEPGNQFIGSGRYKRYCSAACRLLAFRERKKKKCEELRLAMMTPEERKKHEAYVRWKQTGDARTEEEKKAQEEALKLAAERRAAEAKNPPRKKLMFER